MYALGPRARRVYTLLREQLRTLTPGMQLPSISKLATEFGVAPLTVRQVLAQLEGEGFLVREQGRGTFVRERATPAVLVVEDDVAMRRLLCEHVEGAGYRTVEATNPATGLAALEHDTSIALVLSDVRMPTQQEGIAFLRAVHHRWPSVPVAAVTGYPDDLAPLHGTPESPVLVLAKPVWAHQIAQVLHLALRARPGAPGGGDEPDGRLHAPRSERETSGAGDTDSATRRAPADRRTERGLTEQSERMRRACAR